MDTNSKCLSTQLFRIEYSDGWPFSFGFNDGLTQPSVKDITIKDQDGPADAPVRQGVVLLGREGDNGDPSNTTPVERPSWAIDGSFLAFRYLKQLVPEFDHFLEKNALEVPIGFPPNAGKDLLGARLVGRWKSGKLSHLVPSSQTQTCD